ncbi:ATP-binding protein [Jiella sp. MQZ9-1]|uniref:histidine kinase n=1 Tax=Jiella flava TaxID=2816857 RepID=A0A939FVE3_9HYPH|nr:ATP-binding protein [Jiella flava]MBO0662145.1 PAS domain-containing protein [Jiella flava]MCD2470526.1 ATP-binding protein [Jiella flava]
MISVAIVAWDMAEDYLERHSKITRSLIFGLVMGGLAMMSMTIVPSVVPGIRVDLRSSLISTAGLFGGVPAGILAGTMGGLFRVYLGGAGAFAGTIAIAIATLSGALMRYWIGRRERRIGDFLIFALMVVVGNTVSFLALPSPLIAPLLIEAAPPLAVTVFMACVATGWLLDRSEKRRKATLDNRIFRKMVEQLPDSLSFKDIDGRFVAANAAAGKLIGAASEADIIGRTYADFFPKEVADGYWEIDLSVLKAGEPVRLLQSVAASDGGKQWLLTVKAAVRGTRGEVLGIITYIRDVTDETRMAETKSEFISLVSHELRTPLTSIRGALSLLANGMAGNFPVKIQNLIKIAHSNSERLIFLVNDILDMEKIESGKMEFHIAPVTLRPAIDEVIEANASIMPNKQIKVVVEDDAPNAAAMIDVQRFQQICVNLLSNAVKFSPDKSTVTIRISTHTGGVRVAIIDEGFGIPPQFRNRIFQKFERSNNADNRSVGGTGLGLNIAKSITEKMGGQIGFNCHEDRPGTTFFVDLVPADSARMAKADGSQESHKPRILHVEDDDSAREGVAEILKVNFDLTSVCSLEAARRLLSRTVYDLVMLDVFLPDGSGLDLIEHVPYRTPIMTFSDCPLDEETFNRPITIGRKSSIPLPHLKEFIHKALANQGPGDESFKDMRMQEMMRSRRLV